MAPNYPGFNPYKVGTAYVGGRHVTLCDTVRHWQITAAGITEDGRCAAWAWCPNRARHQSTQAQPSGKPDA